MRKLLFYVLVFSSLVMSLCDAHSAVLLHDDFNGSTAPSRYWHIPSCASRSDFIGRTRFQCTQDSPLPEAENGNAIIALKSDNHARFDFCGTDLISNKPFILGQGIRVTVRAKMNTTAPGMVGGIFLYSSRPGRTKVCDEIDFELLTDHPDKAHTNVYKSGGPANGDPQFVPYHPSGSIAGYHTYEIEWLPSRVSWLIDGHLVRTEKKYVPVGPMNVHLNLWAPGRQWAQAYSPDLTPVSTASPDKVFSMSIDS
ncbi:MAG: glycoside hydrolase family 16 protein, partial [Syntrophobacteraceae bacterium]